MRIDDLVIFLRLIIAMIINIPCFVAACMNAILYDAEQLLSNGHAELIHHLYNARILLDEYLRESLHNEYTITTSNISSVYGVYKMLLMAPCHHKANLKSYMER